MRFFKRKTNNSTKTEINRLSKHYRNMTLGNKEAELITGKDYSNLLICLGYLAGKDGKTK